MFSTAEHREKFEALLNNKPDTGAFLETLSGDPVPVHVDRKPDRGQGEKRVMFVYALINDECTGYFLADDSRGVLCLLTDEAQEVLVENNGGSEERLVVMDLYVKRRNFKGTALICELTGDSDVV